jgi:hypothetical protein
MMNYDNLVAGCGVRLVFKNLKFELVWGRLPPTKEGVPTFLVHTNAGAAVTYLMLLVIRSHAGSTTHQFVGMSA